MEDLVKEVDQGLMEFIKEMYEWQHQPKQQFDQMMEVLSLRS